jgi:hypothetical protein
LDYTFIINVQLILEDSKMKTFIKPLACTIAASLLLLACDAAMLTGDNSSVGDNPAKIPPSDIAKEICDSYGECKPEIPPEMPPYNPDIVIINAGLKDWMDDPKTKSDDKRLVVISDMHLADSGLETGLSAIGSNGKVEYFLNGEKISAEEYQSIYEAARQQINFGKRDLSIPGEIVSTSSRSWTVLITAAELAEVTTRYNELAIDFFREVQSEPAIPVSLPWITD